MSVLPDVNTDVLDPGMNGPVPTLQDRAIAVTRPPNAAPDAVRSARPTPAAAAAPAADSGGENLFQKAGKASTDALQSGGDWFGKNRNVIIPLLSGLGAMASSDSRYFGSALLQGLGAGAQAYGKEQQDQATLAGTQADNANKGETGRGIKAESTGKEAALNNAAYYPVTGPDGTQMTWVHAIDENGKRVDIPLGDFYQRQKANPAVRTQSAAELSAAGVANVAPTKPGAVVAPTTMGPNASPAASHAAPAFVPGSGPAGPGSTAPVAAPVAAPGGSGAAKAVKTGVQLPTGYDAISDDDKAAAGNENRMMAVGPIKRDADSIYSNVAERGRTAGDLVQPIKNMTSAAVTGMNVKGGSSPGSGADWRIPLVKALQTAGRVANVNPGELSPSDTADDILKKSQAVLGGLIANRGDQKSNAALQTFMSALPNMGMTPAAMAEITSSVMSQNQRDRDKAQLMQQYKDVNGFNATYENFANRFSAHYSDSRYAQEQHQLQHLYRINPEKVQDMIHSKVQPEAAQEWLKSKGYDPSLARYFF
jgi:hypothetical protein